MNTATVVHRFVVLPERRWFVAALKGWLKEIGVFGRRLICAVRGHDMMLEFAPAHLSLRCTACGLNTPGWHLDVRFPPVPLSRARVVPRTPPLVLAPRRRRAPRVRERAKVA